MTKHIVEKKAPEHYRVPVNIPPHPKFRTILADPPWSRHQTGGGKKYGGAIKHYSLMSTERIKAMPVADLADKDAHLYLWVTNSNIDEGLEVMKAWGFRYVSKIDWNKIRAGLGFYWRNATESCLFGVRGKLPPLSRSQTNYMIEYATKHSEKPRIFIPKLEAVSPGPYLELFCRKRPASREKWWCWGNETEGGADIFIPGYPVSKYSWEKDSQPETEEV